jgi:hypothetical protein
MEIELRFNTGKRDLVATIARPGVKAVVMRDLVNEAQFRETHGLGELNKMIPSQIDVIDVKTGEDVTALEEGESVPVCYWVGGNLVCW